MEDLSATEAARHFSEVLDQVEHRGESFTVVRNGRPVARIVPAPAANGKALLEFLRSHPPDPEWIDEIRALRSSLYIEERNWRA